MAMSKKRRGARRTIEDSERWVSCVGVSISTELLPVAAARELHRGANLHVDANGRPTDRPTFRHPILLTAMRQMLLTCR